MALAEIDGIGREVGWWEGKVTVDATCPICRGPAQRQDMDAAERGYHCGRCGRYIVDDAGARAISLLRMHPTARRDAVSHAVFELTTATGRQVMLKLSADWLRDTVASASLKDPPTQVDNLILFLGRADPVHKVRKQLHRGLLATVAGGSSEPDDVYRIVELMQQDGLVADEKVTDIRGELYDLRLTLKGWLRFNELRQARALTRHGFMAMQFNVPDVDHAFNECFRRATADAGFELRRLDIGQGAGLIDDQLRVAIRTARFLLADLTTGNRGAYWEAGFAEGLGKPVIYLCREDAFSSIHFDTSHMLTVKWSPNALPDARKRLAATIRNTLPGEAILEGTAGDDIEVPPS